MSVSPRLCPNRAPVQGCSRAQGEPNDVLERDLDFSTTIAMNVFRLGKPAQSKVWSAEPRMKATPRQVGETPTLEYCSGFAPTKAQALTRLRLPSSGLGCWSVEHDAWWTQAQRVSWLAEAQIAGGRIVGCSHTRDGTLRRFLRATGRVCRVRTVSEPLHAIGRNREQT